MFFFFIFYYINIFFWILKEIFFFSFFFNSQIDFLKLDIEIFGFFKMRIKNRKKTKKNYKKIKFLLDYHIMVIQPKKCIIFLLRYFFFQNFSNFFKIPELFLYHYDTKMIQKKVPNISSFFIFIFVTQISDLKLY